jgi:hypothetical protein
VEEPMSTIQELIDNGEVVLGETKIQSKNWGSRSWVKVYFKDADSQEWICQDNIGDTCGTPYPRSDFQVYVEPVEMEDRWLWANPDGNVTGHMYTESPSFHGYKFSIKLEGSKTQFPKEKK